LAEAHKLDFRSSRAVDAAMRRRLALVEARASLRSSGCGGTEPRASTWGSSRAAGPSASFSVGHAGWLYLPINGGGVPPTCKWFSQMVLANGPCTGSLHSPLAWPTLSRRYCSC